MRKKDKGILLYLSSDELNCLDDKVKKTNYSRTQFIRKALECIEIKEAPPIDYHLLIREIRRVGNNINQLLALANARGLIITDDLRSSLEMLNNVVDMIYDSFKVDRAKWQ